MTCESCGKEFPILTKLLLNNEDIQMVCLDCQMKYESRGDMEYERQREEGLCWKHC